MEKKQLPRLGRGLDALLGNGHTLSHLTPAKVPISRIQPNPHQPRKNFDEEELKQLEDSIRTHGVLSPILVRPVGEHYQLIAGERRLRAAQRAGLTEIPANVREMDERQVQEAALVENIQRADLNPIEKAAGFKAYLDRYQVTHEQLAARIGVDRSTITNLLGLLNLPAEVQEFVRTGAISLGHAKVLKGLASADQQVALCKEVIAKNLSVHALEALTKQHKEEPADSKDEKAAETGRTAHVQSIEDELRQRLAIRVAIKLKSKDKGQIVLQFDSNDDFERMLEVLRK